MISEKLYRLVVRDRNTRKQGGEEFGEEYSLRNNSVEPFVSKLEGKDCLAGFCEER